MTPAQLRRAIEGALLEAIEERAAIQAEGGPSA